MSDLQLGPVIGKLGGGAEVHTIPVDFVSPSGTGVQHVVDVPVPEGVTARVVVVGVSEATAVSTGTIPGLRIGGVTVANPVRAFAGERVVTGPTVVEANRRLASGNGDPSFEGIVYWWEDTNE